jgi:hypothetical protein
MATALEEYTMGTLCLLEGTSGGPSRRGARTFRDLMVWRKAVLMNSAEEMRRLLNAHASSILAPDFWLPYPAAFRRDIKGAQPLPV